MTTVNNYRVYALCALLVLISICFLVPSIAHAQGGFKALADPGGGNLGQLYSGPTGDFSGFVNKLFKFAISIGAIAAVLRLAYAGFLYMGQSDMWSHKGEAKTIIADVTLGLLLLLGIYLILYQINKDILTLDALRNIKPPEQTSQGATGSSGSQNSPATDSRGPFDAPVCPPGQKLDPAMGATCI